MNQPSVKDLFPYFPLLMQAGVDKAVRLVPKIVEWSQVDDISAVFFQKCMIGKLSPQEAIKDAVEGVQSMLDDKGYYIDNKVYPDLITGRYK